MKWAHALVDGYADSIEAFGEPDFGLIQECEGDDPHLKLVMALDWIAMEPMSR